MYDLLLLFKLFESRFRYESKSLDSFDFEYNSVSLLRLNCISIIDKLLDLEVKRIVPITKLDGLVQIHFKCDESFDFRIVQLYFYEDVISVQLFNDKIIIFIVSEEA